MRVLTKIALRISTLFLYLSMVPLTENTMWGFFLIVAMCSIDEGKGNYSVTAVLFISILVAAIIVHGGAV